MRAVAILDALADGGEAGTTSVARRTGISPSTVSRQLGTLVRLGLVEHVPATGRYRLGVRVLRLANAVLGRLDLRDAARPHLEELVGEVGETATLSIPGDRDAITVDFVPTDRYLQGVTRLGRPSVGHASSAGKVLLAFGSVPAAAWTPAPVHTEDDHRSRRARSRDRDRCAGRAGPRRSRSASRASPPSPRPSGTPSGALAAIVALQGPTSRFDRAAIRKAVPLLLERASAISAGRAIVAADSAGHST